MFARISLVGLILLALPVFATESIRVATVDGGVDFTHPDLAEKKWVNGKEANGSPEADDDNNGYVDDLNGFNLVDQDNVLFNYKALPDEGTFTEAIEGFNLLMKLNAGQELTQEQQDLLEERIPLIKRYILPIMDGMHGTHVSGIIAKKNEDVEIVGLKILGSNKSTDSGEDVAPPGIFRGSELVGQLMSFIIGLLTVTPESLLEALKEQYEKEQRQYLIEIGQYLSKQEVRVANCSWGEGEEEFLMLVKTRFPHIFYNPEAQEKVVSGYRSILAEVYPVLTKSAPKTLFVIASGNSGLNNDEQMTMPSNIVADNKISVASLNAKETELATFSNYGAELVDIAAPGELIESAAPYGQSVIMSGTSMAAPYITKVASMVLEENPELSAKEVKKVLMETADRKASLTGKVKSGVVNLKRAIKAAKNSRGETLENAIALANTEMPQARELANYIQNRTGMFRTMSVQHLVNTGLSQQTAKEIDQVLKYIRKISF